MTEESRCRGCGAAILWGESEDGRVRVPLDPRAPVYEILNVDPTGTPSAWTKPRIRRTKTALVSHFATCPNADQFSAANKGQQTGA